MARKKISRKKKKRLKSSGETTKELQAATDTPAVPAPSVPVENPDRDGPPVGNEADGPEAHGKHVTGEDEKVSAAPRQHDRRIPVVQVVILLLAGLALYIGTLDHTFHFDDKQNIWNDPFIQITSLSFDELRTVLAESNLKSRPVANISFALNYYFNGLDVRGYHVVNILVHLLASVFLYLFFRLTLSLPAVRGSCGPARRLLPFFIALVWLVHPLQVQSVTYIVQRMNSMAGLFFIMGMYFYVKARVSAGQGAKILFFGATVVAALLGFGSKENAATLPAFILLYEWYFLQDLRLRISGRQLFWIGVTGIAFLYILYLLLGASPLERLTGGYGGRTFTMEQRLLTQPRVVLHYVSLLFYPHPGRLTLDYDFPLSYALVDPFMTVLAILLIMGLLATAIYTARENRLYSFAILWFFGNLFIESSTIPLEMVYEHRTYIPSMVGVLIPVLLINRLVRNRKTFAACLAVLVLVFSWWTFERNMVWKDELSLWSDNHVKSPYKARVNQNVGTALLTSGRTDEAIARFHDALRLYLEETKLQEKVSKRLTSFHLRNLGRAYKKKGDYKKAVVYYNRALAEFAFDAETHFDIGFCYTRLWRLDEAVHHLSLALRFAEHHSSDLSMQTSIPQIRASLDKARRLQQARKP